MEAPRAVGRLEGLDFARGLAFLGMLVVNFHHAGGGVDPAAAALSGPLEGRAAAVFVTLAGVGVALRRARAADGAATRGALVRRALVFLAFGYAWAPFWSSDILHCYGAYLLLGALVIDLATPALCCVAFAFVWAFAVLYLHVPYWDSWSPTEGAYRDPWSVRGLVRGLLYDGWHPVSPWFAFFAGGLVLGRLLASGRALGARTAACAAAVALALEFGASRLDRTFAASAGDFGEFLPRLAQVRALFGTGPFPPGPLYVATAGAWAVAVVAASLAFAGRFPRAAAPTGAVGRTALTLYVAHVVLGVWPLQLWIGPAAGGTLILPFTAAFAAAAVLAASEWTERFGRGPLERLLRRVETLGAATSTSSPGPA
jgi:uncharacterized protein